jgi:hypothetical protein
MRTKYFKITRPEDYWWPPTYFKIVEQPNSSSELSIFQGSIDFTLDTGDTFDERIELLYDRRMAKEKVVEVDREEFDLFFKRLVLDLNSLSAA